MRQIYQSQEKAARKIIPSKKRARKANISSDPRVVIDLNTRLQKRSQEEIHNLAEGEMLTSQIKKVENANIICKHGLSWRLINEINGRKIYVRGQLKGETNKDRVRNWYDHCKNLLGSPPDIERGARHQSWLNLLKREEYQEAKALFVGGKSCTGKTLYHQKYKEMGPE